MDISRTCWTTTGWEIATIKSAHPKATVFQGDQVGKVWVKFHRISPQKDKDLVFYKLS